MPPPQPPKVVGSLAKQPGANSGSSPNVQGSGSSPCLISWPSTSLPLVGSVGGGCLLSKTNVRAWVGGALIVFGATAMLPAIIILAAAGFRKTGLASQAAGVAGAIPGPQSQAIAAGFRAVETKSARPIAREAGSRRQSRAREERLTERRVGEPRENRNLRTGRGAIRESSSGTRARRREAANDPAPF